MFSAGRQSDRNDFLATCIKNDKCKSLRMESFITMLHTNQLPYKRHTAGDFIYELGPKKIGFNHKLAVPDELRNLLGENISIALITLSDTESLWHTLLYAIMTQKYESYNWYYRKIMVDQLITAFDERMGRTMAKSQVLSGSNLKQDQIRVSIITPELLFYVCLVLNINIVMYTTGMVSKTEYYFPTAAYDQTLPLIILHCDDRRVYSVVNVNNQTVFSHDNFTSRQIAQAAPKQHPILTKYIGPKCPALLYAQINGLGAESAYKYEKKAELMKLKLTEIKELAARLNVHTEGRATKDALTDKIVELTWIRQTASEN